MNAKRNKFSRNFMPSLEHLEARSLMAAGLSATFAKGVLTVNGTKGADVIQVREFDQRISVDNTPIKVAGKKVDSLAAVDVRQIVIDGKAGADSISLSPDAGGAVSAAASIRGGDGNDRIYGGRGGDKIYGGKGDDFLCGMDGDDALFGEAGNDQLYGGVGGRDRLDGGAGRNYLDGAVAADDLVPRAAAGRDAVRAEPGHHFRTDVEASFSQQAGTTLLDRVDASSTSININGGSGFPTQGPFFVRIDREVMRVVSVRIGVWTVERGANGTTPEAHAAGSAVVLTEQGGQNGQNHKPVPPAIISPIGTAGSVTPTFTWTPVAGALRYELYIADPTASKVLNPQDVKTTSWTASEPLVSGATYEWWVRAIVDDGYDDPWSEPKKFQVTGWTAGTAPFAPEGLGYDQLNRTDIKLTWSNVAGEDGYAVQYWDGTGWTEVTRTGADVTSATISGGIGHYFRVGAFNAAGANFSKYIAAADGGGGTTGGTTGGATGFTSAPTGLKWHARNAADGKLTWSNVDGETGYVIEFWNGSGWAQFASTPADVTQLDVTSGAGAYLRVGATTASGKTVYSDHMLATAGTNLTAPDAPDGLRWAAIAGTDGTLFWNNVAGETGYVVEYWNGSAWSHYGTTAADVNRLYVTNGAGFYFRVGAQNGVGTTYSGYFKADDATGTGSGGSTGNAAAPTAPRLSWSRTNGTDGNLSWTNSTGETSYVIEYWGGSTWIELATNNADVTTRYVTNGTGNYFRVGARNSYGTTYSDFIQAD